MFDRLNNDPLGGSPICVEEETTMSDLNDFGKSGLWVLGGVIAMRGIKAE